MDTFLYFGKVILTSGVMFLYYRLFLKDRTFHHYNRFYLLGAMLVSLLLPLLKVSYFTVEVNDGIYLLINSLQQTNIKTDSHDFSYFRIFSIGFGLVSVLFLGRFLFGIAKIAGFRKHFPKEEFEGINFYRTNLSQAPFSYFRNLFWKDSIIISSDLGRQILKHEMVHIEQKHTADKLFVEIVRAVFWFNPFFYLIKKEIHLIHEYLADKKAVKHSDTKAFAQMLLASHFSGKILPATSPFLSSNLKKRLTMLKKPKTKYSYLRRISALPLLFAVGFAFLVNAKNREIKATNTEIEKAVQAIKKDTVKAVIEPITEADIKPIDKTDVKEEKLKSRTKIAELGSQIQEKSAQLKTLSPNSKEFSEKIDEINSLSGKINEIASLEPAKEKIWIMSGSGTDFKTGAINLTKSGDKMYIELNSPEWKQYLKNLEDVKLDVAFGKDGTDVFRKHPELFFEHEAAKAELDAAKGKISAQNAKKLRKLAKEKAELAKKQQELAKKYAEIANEKVKLYTNINRVQVPKSASTFYFNTKDIGNTTMPNNTRYYLNDKEITKEEMNAVKPDDIASVNINKNSNKDTETAEVRIKTKK